MALDINYQLPSLTSQYSITPQIATQSFLNTYAPNMPKTFSSINTTTTPKAGNKILASGVGMATDYLSNMLTGDMFGDSYLGSTIGQAFSNTLSSAGNTISNNLLKGNTLTQGLGQNIGSSLSGVVAGVAGDQIGKGVTSLMGDSKLGKGIGAGLANGIGSFGGTIGSNLLSGSSALSGLGGFTGIGLGASVVGAGLSAAFGPSKEYGGKYGNITQVTDTAYDLVQAGVSTIPVYGQLIAGGMALNKGLSNIFGSTDAMTTQDAILGSAWAGAPVKWLNMWGSSKTGTFDKQSWQNSEKTSNFMGSSFGNLADRFKKAREEAGKVYGTFSQGAKKEAQENIDFANRAWDKILAMANQDEYQNIRSRDMASINNQRYAQNIQGGFTPLQIGKMGMKILNNTIDHNRGMRYLSAAALIDNKALILSAGNGIKISKLQLGKDIVYSDNTRVSRPDVMQPIQRKLKPGQQFFTRGGQTVVVQPTHAEISQDNRTKQQHQESHKKSVQVRQQKQMEKAQEKTAKAAEAVLEKTSPSYWIEQATGEDLGTVGRLGVDLVSPYVIGKGIQLLGKTGRGLNKLATLGTSSYTGKWTQFGNRYYRFKPGYIGMNGVPVESRIIDSKFPKITPENIASITPAQWTAAQDAAVARALNITPEETASLTKKQYEAAIARGVNTEELSRLRLLHNSVKAPNNKVRVNKGKGEPFILDHDTDNEPWNVYDDSYFGKTDEGWYGKGLYLSGAPFGKNAYGKNTMKLFANVENPVYAKDNFEVGLAKQFFNRGIPKEDALKILESSLEPDELELFLKHKKSIAKALDRVYNADGVIVPLDANEALNRPYSPYHEVVVPDGRKVKSADAVTFDDNGVRIPLGKRDNFNINDIRYGLLPFLGLGTAATLYNKTK